MYRFVSGSLNFVDRGLATKFVVVVVVVVGTFFLWLDSPSGPRCPSC